MSTLFTDSFTRADSSTLGSNYTDIDAGFGIASNTAKAATAGLNSTIINAVSFPADQWVQVSIVGTLSTNADEGAGVVLRGAAGGDLYFVHCSTVDSHLYKRVGGTYTDLSGAQAAFALNDVLYAEVQGTTLLYKKNGTTVWSGTDSALSSGAPGLWGDSSTGLIAVDTLTAGDFGSGGGGSSNQQVDNNARPNKPGRGPNNLGKWFVRNRMDQGLTSTAQTYTDSLTDSLTLSESWAGAATFRGTLSDSLTLGETWAATAAMQGALADSLSLADAWNAGATYPVALSDSLTLSDSWDGIIVLPVDLQDSLTLSDAFAASFTAGGALADSLTLSDTWNGAAALSTALTDSLTLSDVFSGSATWALALSDSVTLSDAFDAVVSDNQLVDSLSVSDSWNATASLNDSLQDSLTLNESWTATSTGDVVPVGYGGSGHPVGKAKRRKSAQKELEDQLDQWLAPAPAPQAAPTPTPKASMPPAQKLATPSSAPAPLVMPPTLPEPDEAQDVEDAMAALRAWRQAILKNL